MLKWNDQPIKKKVVNLNHESLQFQLTYCINHAKLSKLLAYDTIL